MKLAVHKRIVVSCVTFETTKIVQPICYMSTVDRIYLLHYQRPDLDNGRMVYDEFYSEVVRQLNEINHECEIMDVIVEVYDFKKVLRELLKIMRDESEEGNEVYINVSAGTSEYIAAATVASMMMEDVIPYTVATKEYTVAGEGLKIYFESDRPIGMSKEVFDPQLLPTFHIERPPDELIGGLKILREKKEKGHITTYFAMIEALKLEGHWKRRENIEVKDKEQSEIMYYSRHYVDEWIRRGWIIKEMRGGMELTADGLTVTEIF